MLHLQDNARCCFSGPVPVQAPEGKAEAAAPSRFFWGPKVIPCFGLVWDLEAAFRDREGSGGRVAGLLGIPPGLECKYSPHS